MRSAATAERLRRVGIHTVAELESVSEEELVRLLGKASGHGLFHLARAEDDRPVEPERETKAPIRRNMGMTPKV